MEAVYGVGFPRKMYQGLFYIFEIISSVKKGDKYGISKSTTKSVPFLRNYIPCGVPLDRYSPEGRKTANPSILFIGDLDSRKRGRMMTEIFTKDILPRLPDCELTVVGPQPCSGKNIKYAGVISENSLIEEYRKSWVYCMASSYEGFGVPLIEAMACGTAAVTVDNNGASEIVNDGENGFIVRDRDLPDTVLRVLTDRGIRQRLITGGLKTVKKYYDINETARLYERAYKRIISGNR